MFEKELMISGLKRQHELLQDLIVHLENKSRVDLSDFVLYVERTRHIASNLRKLRKIKSDYFNQKGRARHDDAQPNQPSA